LIVKKQTYIDESGLEIEPNLLQLDKNNANE